MLILALDTTTRTSSCAVARDDVVLCEQAGDSAKPQAERLPGDLIALLADARLSLADVDAFAVATGPGSFTGLRIGIATMQGLAFATGKPLVGVSGFDALAQTIFRPPACARSASAGPPEPGEGGKSEATEDRPKPDATGSLIATWVDAWRGEIYAALYENGHEIEAPVVARPEDVLADLRRRIPDPGPRIPDPGSRTPDPITFIGDGAASYRDLILDTLGDGARIADPPSPLLAGVVALIASACTEWHPPHAIRPLYVRRPDAELARQHRTG